VYYIISSVSVSLSGKERAYIRGSRGHADGIVKAETCIKKSIKDAGGVGAFHTAALYKQSGFQY
jgi:hypothetical protein